MPTFLRKTSNRGLTTIEILLVITLLGLIASAVIPNTMSVFRAGVKSSARRYAAMVKYAFDQSILSGRVHRIVLDLDNQTWKVEAAEPGQLPIDKLKQGIIAEGLDDDERVTNEPAFKEVGKNLVDKMPPGVKLLAVESWRVGPDKEVSSGVVSIYAFPNGFIDEATVVLVEEGKEDVQRFRVSTKSLTGRVKVETENKTQGAPL